MNYHHDLTLGDIDTKLQGYKIIKNRDKATVMRLTPK